MNYQAQNLVNMDQVYCRICLESQPKSSLLSPCLCKGTTQYIHEPCLIEWATKNSKHKYNPTTLQFQLQCQICKYQIPLEHQQYQWIRSCRKIVQVIKQQKFKFVIELISIVCMVFCFLFIMRKHFDYQMMGEIFLIYMTLALAVFMGIGVFVLVGCLLYSYGVEVKEEFKVKKVSKISNDTGSAIEMRIQPKNTDQMVN